MDPYRDVVEFYDLEHADFREDIDMYLEMVDDSPVLEVGAGSGRITVALAAAALQVHAVDSSAEMIGHARQLLKEFPNAQFTVADIRQFASEQKFRWAILSLNLLWHLTSTQAQLEALKRIQSLLGDDGTLVVDLTNPLTMADRGADGLVRERFRRRVNDGSVTGFSTCWDHEDRQLLDLSLWFDRVSSTGDILRTSTHLDLRYVYRFELELLLLNAGFNVRQVYGSYQLDPYSSTSTNLIALASVAKPGTKVRV
ncbi:MAG: class I SAM-dependent methyltransferase [Chloroflexota bacterium]